MYSAIILAASLLSAVASAQTISIHSTSGVVASTTISQSMPPSATAGFDASQVNTTVRNEWCQAQLNTCPQICDGLYAMNNCDGPSLTYTCVCANGTVPDCTAFAQTLPFYICEQTYIECVAAHPNDSAGQMQCMANKQCGTRNATAEYLAAVRATMSTAKSTSTSASGSATGASSASATSASATHNIAALSTEITTGAFIAAVLAAFKLLL